MELIITAAIAFAVGAGLIFVLLRGRSQLLSTQIADLQQSLEGERTSKKEELERLKESYESRLNDLRMTEEKLNQSFSHVATRVLDQNASKFQEFASKDLKQLHTMGAGELEQKKQFFDQAIKEMSERIRESQEKISTFEKERGDMYSRLESQMTKMFEQEQLLVRETERLKTALTTSSSVRGRWGELVLRNILQSSDLVEGVDFQEQRMSLNDEGASLKPDFIIKLPQPGQQLVIDCKSSLFESYIAEATAGDVSGQHDDFCKKVRSRVSDLASKEYQKNVTDSAPYVIMFIPSEAAIRVAFDNDADLFQWAMNKRIFIASPATIIPLILLVSKAWNEFKLSSEAKELSRVVDQLGSRLQKFVDRLGKMQRGLDTAVKSWNEAVDLSWNGKQGVVKTIDRAKELGGQMGEVASLSHASFAPRRLDLPARDSEGSDSVEEDTGTL